MQGLQSMRTTSMWMTTREDTNEDNLAETNQAEWTNQKTKENTKAIKMNKIMNCKLYIFVNRHSFSHWVF